MDQQHAELNQLRPIERLTEGKQRTDGPDLESGLRHVPSKNSAKKHGINSEQQVSTLTLHGTILRHVTRQDLT